MNATAVNIYKTLVKVVGVLLVLIGIGALIGGNFANTFVRDQLTEQKITMPVEAAYKNMDQADQDALKPFAGQQMTKGVQARAYSEHFIKVHLKQSAARAKLSEDKANFASMSGMIQAATSDLQKELKAMPENAGKSDAEIAKLAQAEIANPLTKSANAQKAAQLQQLSDSFFQGSALRGMLLNAYGWGLVGTIVTIVGWVALIVGILLVVFAFVYKGKTSQSAQPVANAGDKLK